MKKKLERKTLKPFMLIRVTKSQAYTIIQALDLYSRVGMQQLEAVEQAMRWDFNQRNVDITSMIRAAKRTLGQPDYGSWGIAQDQVSDKAKIAYDLQCVLRRPIALAEAVDGHSTWFNLPLHLGSEPLAEAKVLKTKKIRKNKKS
jgi:hypothetical protein